MNTRMWMQRSHRCTDFVLPRGATRKSQTHWTHLATTRLASSRPAHHCLAAINFRETAAKLVAPACNFNQGRTEEGGQEEYNIPGAESLGGTPKVPTMSQVLFSIHYICFRRPQVRTWGCQTCFLPRAPSNLVTSLVQPVRTQKERAVSKGLLFFDLSTNRCVVFWLVNEHETKQNRLSRLFSYQGKRV